MEKVLGLSGPGGLRVDLAEEDERQTGRKTPVDKRVGQTYKTVV